MEIVSENAHRCLVYIGMVNQGGTEPLARHVDEYWFDPRPKGRRGFESILAQFAREQSALEAWSKTGELPSAYLHRMGWVYQTQDNGLLLTPTGRALVRSLELYDTSNEEVVEAVLDVDDPFAYVKAIGLLRTGEEPALLVDPYLRAAQLNDVYRIPTISRVLVSRSLKADDLHHLAHAAQVVAQQRSFEVRKAAAIHDRYLIPDSGQVRMLGGSLNTVGRSPITLTSLSSDLSAHVRSTHEDLWANAEVVEYEAQSLVPPAGQAEATPISKPVGDE